MYFLSGEHVTGWQQLDGGTYHFDDDGIVHDTETVDTRTCTTNGYAITTCRTCGRDLPQRGAPLCGPQLGC